jgi:hypothetical protein
VGFGKYKLVMVDNIAARAAESDALDIQVAAVGKQRQYWTEKQQVRIFS